MTTRWRTGAHDVSMARLRGIDPAANTQAELVELDPRARADLEAILAGQTREASHHFVEPEPRAQPSRVLAAAALALVLAGGGTAAYTALTSPQGPGEVAAADRAPTADADALAGALRSATLYDYNVATTPAQLATSADLVAIGSFQGFALETANTDGLAAMARPSTLMRLGQVRVLQGQLSSTDAGAAIEVAVPFGGEEALSDATARALPLGTSVLVFASRGAFADGHPTWRVTGPQSLVVQGAGDRVVWPLLGAVKDGELRQALPDGDLIAP